MPFSFIEIEERKTRIIFFLFAFLVLFYFFSIWVLSVTVKLLFFFRISSLIGRTVSIRSLLLLMPLSLSIIFLAALAVGGIHWYYSTTNIIHSLLTLLKAHLPDKEDRYHQRLQNIVDELSVATGGKRFECWILPTSAMNAFSIADLNNRAVIGVTEGVLPRLNRAQLEAVVAHEAAHIVSQDALIKSVVVSIYGIFGFILEGLRKTIEKSGDSQRGTHPSIIIVYIVTSVLYGLSRFLSLFISRQCEYRADAVAVRLTRDPYSLAQGLYRISKKWRGGGTGYEIVESLFILNPNYSKLDEKEGFFANLFSTHPPILNRIDILLNMAHSDLDSLEKEVKIIKRPRRQGIEVTPLKEPRWFIIKEGKWQGPFLAQELISLGLFQHESFIKREESTKINLAYQDSELLKRISGMKLTPGGYQCPRCYKNLDKVLYEGASLYQCESCRGVSVEEEKIVRFLTREEQGFSEEVIREAKATREAAKKIFLKPWAKMENELSCPKCKKIMRRSFYSSVYPVEIDRCYFCHLIWFDKDELEILQYLVENKQDI